MRPSGERGSSASDPFACDPETPAVETRSQQAHPAPIELGFFGQKSAANSIEHLAHNGVKLPPSSPTIFSPTFGIISCSAASDLWPATAAGMAAIQMSFDVIVINCRSNRRRRLLTTTATQFWVSQIYIFHNFP